MGSRYTLRKTVEVVFFRRFHLRRARQKRSAPLLARTRARLALSTPTLSAPAVPRAHRLATMSIKMTTQMDWMHHSSYSPNHPENMNKVGNLGLPSPVVGPPPVLSISEVEKKTQGAWGHTLCCERAYGPCETTTRIKGACTPQGHRFFFSLAALLFAASRAHRAWPWPMPFRVSQTASPTRSAPTGARPSRSSVAPRRCARPCTAARSWSAPSRRWPTRAWAASRGRGARRGAAPAAGCVGCVSA